MFLSTILRLFIGIFPACCIASAGYLKSFDEYMNIHLLNSEEWVDGSFKGSLGEVLIRCNNVLYIRQVQGEDDAEEAS